MLLLFIITICLHFISLLSGPHKGRTQFSTKGMAEYSPLSHDKSLQTSLFEPNCHCMHHFPLITLCTVMFLAAGDEKIDAVIFWNGFSCHHSLRSSLKYLDQKNSMKATSETRLTCKVTGNEIYNQKLISEILTTPNNSPKENLHIIGDVLDSRYCWHLLKFAFSLCFNCLSYC